MFAGENQGGMKRNDQKKKGGAAEITSVLGRGKDAQDNAPLETPRS